MLGLVPSKTKPMWLAYIGLSVAAVALTLTTAIFSTVPLMAVRRLAGRWVYILLSALALSFLGAFVSAEFCGLLLVAVVAVGVYMECEEQGFRIFPAATISLLFSSGLVISFLTFLAEKRHGDIFTLFQQGADIFVQQATQLDPQLKLSSSALAQQGPSGLFIALMISMWTALLWSGREQYFIIRRKEFEPLMAFTLPDFFIWILLASVAGTFLDWGQTEPIKIVAMNLMNIMAVLYFFQGIAVTGTFFRVQRVSSIWRVFGYVVLVFQLFLFVCLLGLVDYWGDFRMKMIKRSAERIGEA